MVQPPKFLTFQKQPFFNKPEKFTFPFYYSPHPFAIRAAEELQEYLNSQTDFDHNFGLNEEQSGQVIGKMFGVLVVENTKGEIGYLAAFSGKLAGENHHEKFVPPVFDMLYTDSFFLREEETINTLNRKIELLELNPKLEELRRELLKEQYYYETTLTTLKNSIKEGKKIRKEIRDNAINNLPPVGYENLILELNRQSLQEQHQLTHLKRESKQKIANLQQQLNEVLIIINEVKEKRKVKSAALQKQLFEKYTFLNSLGKSKSLYDIFLNTSDKKPPAGAGECAAPKLLHYAFQHRLKPLCLAEFWWGASPGSEIKLHGNYYPACRGKCEPILSHMLEGIETDPNPMLSNPAEGKELEIIFEDEVLLIINKPAEFLSVPGKTITDSVYTRIKKRNPEISGPIIVHRLDMSTSGIMLLAKNKEIHQFLQRQFIKRTIKKRYIAVLDGIVDDNIGTIDLPIRVDLDDRPRQLVCYEHGKAARTEWEVIERKEEKTYIHFYPITGRTHQLRVHAAHHLGLNAPIMGDDLYGTKGDRLHLHAEFLEILHPISKERMKFEVKSGF